MSRFFLFFQILLLGVILAPSSLNAQKGDQQLKRKFSNESTRIRIPISSANSDLNNQEVFQTKWINNSPSEILDILLVEKSVEKEGILYPSQQMMDRIWLTLLASVDPIADSSDDDDTGGGDNAKRGLVPLPKPDSNPNGAGPDDVLKISDEAACVAKGGVWVSRGDTGFCYLKIKAEEPPELEPIDDNDSGGPTWNNGSNNNLFEGNLQRSSDSSGGGDSGPLGATSRTTQIEYGLIAALMSVEGGVAPLKSSASALIADDDDTGGGDNAKRGLVPLPKPDSNPNGAGPDDVLKISDEAACVAKGGVWVSRGDTGFCYLKIKAEEPPELEPIDDNDSGGPTWNNGSNNNLFEGNLQRSSDSSGGGDSGPLGATSRTTQIEYGLIAALMSVEGGVAPLKSSASALVVNDVGRDLTRRENAELQNLIDTLSSSQVTQALTAGEHAVGTDVIILSRRHGTGGVEAVVLVNCQ